MSGLLKVILYFRVRYPIFAYKLKKSNNENKLLVKILRQKEKSSIYFLYLFILLTNQLKPHASAANNTIISVFYPKIITLSNNNLARSDLIC